MPELVPKPHKYRNVPDPGLPDLVVNPLTH